MGKGNFILKCRFFSGVNVCFRVFLEDFGPKAVVSQWLGQKLGTAGQGFLRVPGEWIPKDRIWKLESSFRGINGIELRKMVMNFVQAGVLS